MDPRPDPPEPAPHAPPVYGTRSYRSNTKTADQRIEALHVREGDVGVGTGRMGLLVTRVLPSLLRWTCATVNKWPSCVYRVLAGIWGESRMQRYEMPETSCTCFGVLSHVTQPVTVSKRALLETKSAFNALLSRVEVATSPVRSSPSFSAAASPVPLDRSQSMADLVKFKTRPPPEQSKLDDVAEPKPGRCVCLCFVMVLSHKDCKHTRARFAGSGAPCSVFRKQQVVVVVPTCVAGTNRGTRTSLTTRAASRRRCTTRTCPLTP